MGSTEMNGLLRVWAVVVVATKRLLSQRWLTFAAALGLAISVALTMSIPLYAEAVYHRLLFGEISGRVTEEGIADNVGLLEATGHPPFAFMFRYDGAWAGSVEWEDVQPVDAYLSGAAGSGLGLPQKLVVRHLKTDKFRLFPQREGGVAVYADSEEPLTWMDFACVSELEEHITVLEGHFPAVASASEDSPVEVLVSESFATELGLQVGEMYTAFARRDTSSGTQVLEIPMRIAGVWRAMDPEEDFWFYGPRALSKVFLVPEQTFHGRLGTYIEDEVYLGLWYLVMDGSGVRSSDVNSLLARTAAVEQRAAALLPNTKLDVSPRNALQAYRRSARLLTVLLYASSVPIVGLILAFISLVVGLAVQRQRNEIAVLRSRGATLIQIVGTAALQALLLGVVALAVGLPVGVAMTLIIGKARSFLDFTLQSDLRVTVTAAALGYGATVVGLALLAQVAPTVGAARHTIVTYKQERARALRPPWWRRAWLDVLLLIPAAYGAYLLRKQGSIVLPAGGGRLVNDPFQNPLLFLVPALGIFALTLFILRLLPAVMAVIAWIASHTSSVGVLLATRHLSRAPGFYTAPLILLILTLSLSAFTASLAQTLDHDLYDRTYYYAGADMRLVESGDSTGGSGPFGGLLLGGGGGVDDEEEEEEGPLWRILPVSEHLKVEGVQKAARIGRYRATTRLSGRAQTGVFIGVDYFDFVQVAFWRDDFAQVSLGELMNALALQPDGVLAHRGFMGRHALNVGDTFRLMVHTFGRANELDVKVVGAFDLFPTWYPYSEAGTYEPLFVGNLEYLFEQAGWQFPYNVWLKTDPQADYEQVEDDLRRLDLRVLSWRAPLLTISDEQRRPERQGLFGVLSVGFIAAAVLTVLGFLLYAFFSFRRRFIELGILRAIGLSSRQMAVFLAWELVFLLLVGVVAGTGLGTCVSHLFIPSLQVGADATAQVPPFVVDIAWPDVFRIYVLFGLLFVAALGGLTALLLRMKIFQAIKLGETT